MQVEFTKLSASLKFGMMDEGVKYNYSMSVLRTVLIYAALGALVIADEDNDDESVLTICAEKLLKPSDGDVIRILDSLLPLIWQAGRFEETTIWFSHKISAKCYAMISERNNRVGHGVFDQATAKKSNAIIELIDEVLKCVNPLLPTAESGRLVTAGQPFPLPFDSEAIYCLREVSRKAEGWRCRYQLIDYENSTERSGFLHSDSILLKLVNEKRDVLSSRYVTESWTPSFVIPNRQTSSFVGRRGEVAQFIEWWNDLYSRACLVYGEGGIGKTTLVLEILNKILDAEEDVDWQPELLFFFSSKETRWGVSGLEYIANVNANISEAMRKLIQSLGASLDSTWYSSTPSQIIQKASQVISDLGLKDKVLIVIDNAENLVKAKEDEANLAMLLKLISRKVGRLVVTSRRREMFESEPINVLALDVDDAVTLLEKLGDAYGVSEIETTEPIAKRFF